MKTDELREKYLEFFESKGHTRCPSDVLVPTWDPSVLFTPAGMNQFKDHFLGKVKLDFTRAATCQKCLRTGDIDNVGRTAYHHTFFEMLGNFSFGDYFKRDAIHWAWEFLTDKKWLGLDPQQLTVTVYLEDDEAAEIWAQEIGLESSRIERMGEHDNFWPAGAPTDGPDGVCSPCSEIFYHPPGGGPEVEIWNLVFTQFNRVGDPPENLRPLPSKNIDTGMGLERTAATLQGVDTNYHIDILLPLVEAAAEVCGRHYEANSDEGRRLRRIADHVRACTFAIHENVYPGPNKEKYVIKRLLRRAVLDGHQMGLHEPFLHRLVPAVVETMTSYPDLRETVERVAGVIQKEEANFFGTIDAGLDRIETLFTSLQQRDRTTVDGSEAAELYQTYGVPPELFESMASERGLTFDWVGFRQAMEKHGAESGKLAHGVMGDFGPIDAIKKAVKETKFVGYETTECVVEVKGIIAADQPQDRITPDPSQDVMVVLDRSPFYGESGGQVGDAGTLVADGLDFQITDTQRDGGLILHHGRLQAGELTTGARVNARVDPQRREAIRRAHSATHILHHALQTHLGTHAQQQGSKVEADWLRFDFTNLSPVSLDELQAVERDANQRIADADSITAEILPLADARQQGAMMLFGEKYPDPVRMVSMGDFSKELCGGTHLANTRDVGPFEIIAEEAVSAGTRRVIALTGERADEHTARTRAALSETAEKLSVGLLQTPEAARHLSQRVRDLKKQLSAGKKDTVAKTGADKSTEKADPTYAEIKVALRETARILNVAGFDVPGRVSALHAEADKLVKELEALAKSSTLSADSLLESATDVNDVKVVVADVPGANPNMMRQLIDQLRKQISPIAVLLAASPGPDKVLLVAGLSRDLVDRGGHAGKWIGAVAEVVNGRGGGKPDMAQAGGKDVARLPEALEVARDTIRQQ